MIAESDWKYFKEWATDGHYDNGDYTLIGRVLPELIALYEQQRKSVRKNVTNRLSLSQRKLLAAIQQGNTRIPRKQRRTLDSLVRRGLVKGTWRPPAPGNDYGGVMEYRLTLAGEAVL